MSFDTKRPSAQQASDDGHTFEPVYPDGSGIGATITVRGPRSTVVREYARRQFALTQAREASARKVGKLLEPPELDELDESLTDMALAYTMGWDGMTQDDQPLPFSADAARALFTAHPWLREQVIAEGQDLGKFVSPSRMSSSSTPGQSSS